MSRGLGDVYKRQVEEIPADSVVEIDTFDELCKIDETYRNAE